MQLQVCWTELVEPLDVEQEIESQVEITSNQEKEVQAIADYPKDDLQVSANYSHLLLF